MTAVSELSGMKPLLIKWAPRVIAVAIGGYYGLGIAYELGLMALIDQIAIPILKHFFGYAGVGAFMPTVQWYAAWGMRVTIGLAAGFIYDRMAKSARSALSFFKGRTQTQLAARRDFVRAAFCGL